MNCCPIITSFLVNVAWPVIAYIYFMFVANQDMLLRCAFKYNRTFLDCRNKNLSTVPNGWFNHMVHVYHADLSLNKIKILTKWICPDLVYLNLSRNRLTAIREDAFTGMSNLVILDLSDNLLPGVNIDSTTFAGLNNLEDLILSGNPILFLGERAVNSLEMPFLQYLDLSFDGISTIATNAIADLQNVERISLRGNRLSEIDFHIFKGLESLNSLDISENPITKIDDKFFCLLKHLENLTMESCQLRHIGNMAFQGADSLKYLSLRNNSLETISAEALLGMSNLEELVMNENPLQVIDGSVFRELPASQRWSIQRLRLQNMPHLYSIESMAFAHLRNLREISIQNNSQLKTMNWLAFSRDHPTIRRVHLDNNSLSTLSKKLLPWGDLESVTLAGNRWYCDCRLKWAVCNDVLKSKSSPIICHGPSKHEGRNLFDLTVEDLGCISETVEDQGLNLGYFAAICLGSIYTPTYIILLALLVMGYMMMSAVIVIIYKKALNEK